MARASGLIVYWNDPDKKNLELNEDLEYKFDGIICHVICDETHFPINMRAVDYIEFYDSNF